MKKVWIGIDPGLTGAVAAIYSDEPPALNLRDAPSVSYQSGGKNRNALSEALMSDYIREMTVGYEPFAAIEWAQAMPKQGVSSSFNYGVGFGMWLGVLAALGVPHAKVRPQAWMKAMFVGHGSHDKSLSMKVALELFPLADISLKKHHGRAEALLLAEYIRRSNP